MRLLLVLIFIFSSYSAGASDFFDLRKDFKKVESVDLVIFEGYTQHGGIGGLVKAGTFVVGKTQSKVIKTVKGFKWNPKDLNELLAKNNPKLKFPGDCLCRPKYVFAFIFYIKSDSPFSDEEDREKAAIAMFDEAHNSIMISDQQNGIKHYRLSEGHKKTSLVPIYISKILKSVGVPYKFMDSGRKD